jgi:hypothetical protein
MMSVILSFVDERQFLTVIQLILPLHECADPAPAESAAAESPPTESAADPAPAESSAKPLHSIVGAASTETY